MSITEIIEMQQAKTRRHSNFNAPYMVIGVHMFYDVLGHRLVLQWLLAIQSGPKNADKFAYLSRTSRQISYVVRMLLRICRPTAATVHDKIKRISLQCSQSLQE